MEATTKGIFKATICMEQASINGATEYYTKENGKMEKYVGVVKWVGQTTLNIKESFTIISNQVKEVSLTKMEANMLVSGWMINSMEKVLFIIIISRYVECGWKVSLLKYIIVLKCRKLMSYDNVLFWSYKLCVY